MKALCGKATSWGQSSTEGTPTTLEEHRRSEQQPAFSSLVLLISSYKKKNTHFRWPGINSRKVEKGTSSPILGVM